MSRVISMSEFDGDASGSAGSRLKAAREASGLHIAALAVLLKVPVKRIESLEADRFDELPDAAFARALACSVCRTLKMDPASILALLPPPPTLAYSNHINAPFRSPRDGPGPSWLSMLSQPAVVAGLVLVAGALVLLLLPDFSTLRLMGDRAPTVEMPPQATPSTPPSPTEPVSAVEPGLNQTELKPDTALVVPGTLAEASVPAATSLAPRLAVNGSAAPAVAADLGSASGAGPAANSSDLLVLSAAQETWVEVTDARGTVVLRRTLQPGEVAAASGVLPLSAIVGRADSTQARVRGQALDLLPLARNNVARFEVK
jgi:cytoskeleton protein RodZ